MPKPLREYRLQDWKRLRPLTHAWKTARYRLVTALYVRRGTRSADLATVTDAVRGTKLLVTIAYNDSEIVRWQTALIEKFVPNATYVIADNSSDPTAASRIRAAAAEMKVPYLKLPRNPWAMSRSHGLAMNWVWRNLIRPGRPRAFGFLDQDLLPTAPDDPFAALETQRFYGRVRSAGSRWFLWAGFCMFRFDRVQDERLDFGQDWFAGLDTGGGNWDVLYCAANRADLKEVPYSLRPLHAGTTVEDCPVEWNGTWLHEVGNMGRVELRAEKRAAIGRLVTALLDGSGQAGEVALQYPGRPPFVGPS